MDRRDLLKSGVIALGAGVTGSMSSQAGGQNVIERVLQKGQIKLTRDCLDLDAVESSSLLAFLAHQADIEFGHYSCGGVVRKLEEKLALALGKEDAIFMPTGTLANHIALTTHCQGDRHRVLTQAESHIYNDTGDCAQVLGRLSVLPLSPGSASFTLEDVKERVQRTRASKVKFDIGAIAIESPVRRAANAHFDFEEMKRISSFAKDEGIAMHLDGARIFIESAYTGIDVTDYTKHFDSVYVSLYKTFHTPSGAILAGTKSMIEGLYHVRRMYGSSMPQVWPFAAIALAFVDGTVGRLKNAIKVIEHLKSSLKDQAAFRFRPIANGTNVTHLVLKGSDPEVFRAKLAEREIILPAANPKTGVFNLKTNETLNRDGAAHLVDAFRASI